MSLLLSQQFHTYFVLLLKDELIWPMPAPKVDFMFPAACRKHCFNTSKQHFKYPGNRFYVLQLRTNPMILCVTIMNPYQQHLGMQTTPIVNLLVQTPVQMLQPYLTVYSMRSFEVILLDCPERSPPLAHFGICQNCEIINDGENADCCYIFDYICVLLIFQSTSNDDMKDLSSPMRKKYSSGRYIKKHNPKGYLPLTKLGDGESTFSRERQASSL